MKGYRRLISITGILLVIAIISMIAAFMLLPKTEFVRTSIEKQLSAATGHDVKIGEIIAGPSITRLVSITIKNASLTSHQGEKLLSVAEIVLKPQIFPLLKRELVVDAIKLTNLQTFVTRNASGNFENFLIPVPVSSQNLTPAVPEGAPSNENNEAKQQDQNVKWSINSVELLNSNITYYDYSVYKDRPITLSLDQVKLLLTADKDPASFVLDLSGVPTNASSEPIGLVKASGRFALSREMDRLEHGSIDTSAEISSLQSIRQYTPHPEYLKSFSSAAINARLTYEQNVQSEFNIELKKGLHPESLLKITGRIEGDPKSNTITSAKVDLNGKELVLDDFPIKGAGEFLNLEKSFVNVSVQSDWKDLNSWSATGTIESKNLEFSGIPAKLLRQPSVNVVFDVDPGRAEIKKLTVVEKELSLDLSGSVKDPFSSTPYLDLTVQSSFHSWFLKNLGIKLPQNISLNGSAPVTMFLKGSLPDSTVKANLDLKSLGVRVDSFEKPIGSKGNASFTGTLTSLLGNSKNKQNMVQFNVSGIKLKSERNASTELSVGFASTLTLSKNDLDLTQIDLKINQPGSELLHAKGDALNLGTGKEKLSGSAGIHVSPEILSILGSPPPGLEISGNSVAKLKFSGSASDLSWSGDLPLTNVDVRFQDDFRKPKGMNSNLTASGKLVSGNTQIREAALTLQNSRLIVKDVNFDSKGNLGDLNVTIGKLDLKDAAGVIPQFAPLRPTGTLDGAITLKSRNARLLPFGSIRIHSVDLKPQNAGWIAEKVSGEITLAGEAVKVPELTGKINGGVETTVKISADLARVFDTKTLSGEVRIQSGSGTIKAPKLRNALMKTENLVSILLDSDKDSKNRDPLQFEKITGDLAINSGIVTTENVRLKAPKFGSGAIGSYNLTSNNLDILFLFRTETNIGQAIGKIPGVQDVLKRHGDLLKITGLDKELKKLGIDNTPPPEDKPQEENKQKKTPLIWIFQIKGPSTAPEISPVLESTLGKPVLTKLKDLAD